jgi:hypothetical protein
MPEILAILPIPPVIAIPREPPISTRRVGGSSFDPEVRADRTPVKTNPPRVNPTMLHACVSNAGAKAPTNGISPPKVNEIAEAIAA